MPSSIHDPLKIFSGSSNRQLATEICDYVGLPLGKIELTRFPDGELHCQVMEDIRGRNVFLVQSTCPPVNDNLMELLIMIECCRRANAAAITAVIPYFGYARQDRKDAGRVPITAKLVANMIAAAGADRVVSMDLHAAQIQGFFDCPVDHLYAAPALNSYFAHKEIQPEDLVIVSPDEGSIKRAAGHQTRLGGSLAIVDKRRKSGTKTSQENIIGPPVDGKICLMFDDMISTAGSICGAAEKLSEAGAKEIYVAATHGVLCDPAIERIAAAPINECIVTDTIPLSPEKQIDKMRVQSISLILSKAIMAIHRNESVSALFDLSPTDFDEPSR